MKTSNIFKYIFILFAIGLIVYAGYTIYQNNKVKEQQAKTEEDISTEQVIEIKDLRLGITGFDTMNPLISTHKEVLNMDKLIFEPLISLDENYKATLCLATEWSKTSPTTYVIKINNEIKWQDNTPITAKDVQFTIDRLKEGKSIYSYNVKDVQSVEVIDASTIKINLVGEVPFFEYNLIFPILPYHHYVNEDFYTTTKIPMGTGMYKITNIGSSTITLQKNEKWWKIKEENSKIETITIHLYASMGEVFNSFKIGNIDLVNTSNMNFKEYIGTIGFQTKEYSGREYEFLSFNCQDEIIQDKAVRKAIDYAIDKANIISTVWNNQYSNSEFPLDYGNYLYTNTTSSSGYNPEQAKKVLEEAGWIYKNNKWQKKDEDGVTRKLNLTLAITSGNDTRKAVADLIKEQLGKIGIQITIKQVSDSQYNSYIEKKNYQILLTGVYNSYSPDLTYYFGPYNLENYQNEEMISIINTVKDITDETILKEKYKRIYELYKEDVPFISLYRNKNVTIYNQNLLGEVTPNNYTSFYHFSNWYRQ